MNEEMKFRCKNPDCYWHRYDLTKEKIENKWDNGERKIYTSYAYLPKVIKDKKGKIVSVSEEQTIRGKGVIARKGDKDFECPGCKNVNSRYESLLLRDLKWIKEREACKKILKITNLIERTQQWDKLRQKHQVLEVPILKALIHDNPPSN